MIRLPSKLESWPYHVLRITEGLLTCDDENDLIICDGSDLEWISPIGLCGLVASACKLASRGITVRFENLSPSMEAYFDRMDVFTQCGIERQVKNQRQDLSHRLLEVHCVGHPAEVGRVATALGHAITGEMMSGHEDHEDPDGMHCKPSERLSLSLEYVLSELMENAVTHAQAHGFAHAKVWVAANYYAQNDSVRVGLVDNGCGFLNSLASDETVKAAPSHINAVKRALEPFVSCNKAVGILDDSSNQGIGLTVCADIAREAGGHLLVGSGDACWNATSNISYPHHGAWQGAAIEVLLHRDRLLTLDLPSIISPYQPETQPNLRFE